jgi:WD40 repeat protein
VDSEREIMKHPAPAMNNTSVIIPYRKIKGNGIDHILHLPGGQRVIGYSWSDSSFQVWDLERGTQVGKEWEDKEEGVRATALSPDGNTIASGSRDGSVKLWNINTGKVIETWTGHTNGVVSLCWSPDGGRVGSGSQSSTLEAKDATFRVWDVESGKTILGPINTGKYTWAGCYSPDGKMIAIAGDIYYLEIWDANSGELLKTIERYDVMCLAWTSDGKTLITGEFKIDTATWTLIQNIQEDFVKSISLSPNERSAHPCKHTNLLPGNRTMEPRNQSTHRNTTSP